MRPVSDDCARQVLEVVPPVMRAIRAEMRRRRPPNITIPQFRSMAFLSRHEGASLSDVAGHIGLTLPSMSCMISRLVERGLVERETMREDRRRLALSLTPRGRRMLETARTAAQSSLAARLASLSSSERRTVRAAMELLGGLFTPARRAEAAPPR